MMTFPEAAFTDLDPCPVHTERSNFVDVVGARHRHFAYIFRALEYHLMSFSGRQKYIHTHFGTEMSQITR